MIACYFSNELTVLNKAKCAEWIIRRTLEPLSKLDPLRLLPHFILSTWNERNSHSLLCGSHFADSIGEPYLTHNHAITREYHWNIAKPYFPKCFKTHKITSKQQKAKCFHYPGFPVHSSHRTRSPAASPLPCLTIHSSSIPRYRLSFLLYYLFKCQNNNFHVIHNTHNSLKHYFGYNFLRIGRTAERISVNNVSNESAFNELPFEG